MTAQKSTFFGRLLYDSKMVFEDQLGGPNPIRKRSGTQRRQARISPARRCLAAERRNRGITHRCSGRTDSSRPTNAKSSSFADTPGARTILTSNMVTGASRRGRPSIVIDGKQRASWTKNSTSIAISCSLFGIRHIVLAINKDGTWSGFSQEPL